ncbi:helix-turn-helix transcriptional regulator [Streptomyces sp. NBC_01669]|uniref:helix-turn-helix domain-containing protein n=1 Tax=Streptomyces sp. NBC_01669 TaxID=2975909 RepID=UPI0022571076|nr:helix-turn-helix transcriptional regulator [Streptomyces sp. NBC_01669]MCX4531560.1 helix-turn-helix transcriptional regulator [Streptomyces sp. NBC_01669]
MTPLPLTRAQGRVLSKIAEGSNTDETADELAIAPGTVSVQLISISRKLGVSGRAALVHAAYLTEQLSRPEREAFDGEFTDTEIQTWRLVASGASAQLVADVCRISRDTARDRIRILRRRVDAANDPHLVTLGWRYGVVDDSLVDMASGVLIAVPVRG